MPWWSNGLGEALGDSLILRGSPILHAGTVWYVDSENGTDGAAPAGKERLAPLATLGQAITNASAGDTIVLLSGHDETVTATVSKKLVIAGAGESDGLPGAKLTASGTGLTVSADDVQLRNLYLTGGTICALVSGDRFRMKGCYVECTAGQTAGLRLSKASGFARVDSSTFLSTYAAGEGGGPPGAGIDVAAQLAKIEMSDVILDGGTLGFSLGCGYDEDGVGGAIDLLVEDMSLLRGADMRVNSANTGYIQVGTATGSSQIRQDAS